MTQYHYLDESGDPGLDIDGGASTHFALVLVQLAKRESLPELVKLRQSRHLPSSFEFKYHKTTAAQKTAFFKAIQNIPFRVRGVVINKANVNRDIKQMSGQDLVTHFITQLTLRASPLDIADDILVIDGATPAFRRTLRIKLSAECKEKRRIRPFKKIVGKDSKREDGL
ncbi:MAG TPA: DUF3800 domain-containing protein, partial [Chloroflexi bacterium]|nr:DUF3800 domain-containing protein [Chloroflexota bacterium]